MATFTVPQVVPSPVEDAEALMKAFQGYLTSGCFGFKLAEKNFFSRVHFTLGT
jgi:hypothetical protein